MNRRAALTAIVPTLMGLLWAIVTVYNLAFDPPPVAKGAPAAITLSQPAMTHILYGDDHGGGHLHGTGRPCKSEFPESWDRDKVINTVTQIAANDNQPWRREDNGYYVGESMVQGVRVRVVLNREQDGIITAYPTNMPRNPCPGNPANDNAQ